MPLLLATLIAAFFGALLARRGRELEGLLVEQARLRREIAGLERQNARLKAERDALLNSPEAIERVAREDYGFAAPGESADAFESSLPEPAPAPLRVTPPSLWALAISWRRVSLLLPAAAFVVTALILAAWNLAVGRAARDA